MPFQPDAVDVLCVNTIRTLAVDAVEKANSGHPGLPLGAAPMGYVLYAHHLRQDPKDPRWPDRDRFVLSAGHGSMLQYALLHLMGYALTLDDLKSFRQWESKTPGHPEFGVVPGVEATTGPLGQGSAVAVGMAIAERLLAARFNRPGHEVVDHHTFAIVSDGDLMEGISHEAASLAGHLKLGKLVYLYDANNISLDGPLSETFTEDVAARFRAYGWHVQRVEQGDTDLAGIDEAIAAARDELDRPSLIVVRTTIGYGAPTKAGTHQAHGAPLGGQEAAETKKRLGFDPAATFVVPGDAAVRFRALAEERAAAHRDWQARFDAYAREFPELAEEFRAALAGRLPAGWEKAVPSFDPGPGMATREAGGKVLAALGPALPALVGADADLASSTKTRLAGTGDFDASLDPGRNVRAGVREHAMGAIANGIAYHGGLVPFTATFLAFSDYMRTPIRLASLDHLKAMFVFTHDSLGVGEDGPTHQPVEQVTALRAIPGLPVMRPGDANETAAAWRWWLAEAKAAGVMVLSRQKLPTLPGTKEHALEGLRRGGYVLADADGGAPDAIVMASGSELHLAAAARDLLAREGVRVRVVSMPCMDQFEAQDRAYIDAVLPPSVKARVAVEAGVGLAWYRWIGEAGRLVTVERFGASAPGELVLRNYGFTPENVASKVREALAGRS